MVSDELLLNTNIIHRDLSLSFDWMHTDPVLLLSFILPGFADGFYLWISLGQRRQWSTADRDLIQRIDYQLSVTSVLGQD